MTPEGKIKEAHKKLLQKNGWLVIHLMQTNFNGCPDTMAIRKKNVFSAFEHSATLKHVTRIVFIEYKVPGEFPDPLQDLRHEQLSAAGMEIIIVTDPTTII